jgi:hypothetical protein
MTNTKNKVEAFGIFKISIVNGIRSKIFKAFKDFEYLFLKPLLGRLNKEIVIIDYNLSHLKQVNNIF